MSAPARLAAVLAVNLVMLVALLLVGVFAHSLGVLASGADYLGDALGTALALAAMRINAGRGGRTRATSLAALANATFLLLVTVSVALGAVHRLLTGAPVVHGIPVVVVSVLAAASMIGCALILGDAEGDLSMESVMLDSVADAAAAIGVAVSGAIILLADGLYWLDSAVALLIAIVVAHHAIRLLRRVLADLRASGARSAQG